MKKKSIFWTYVKRALLIIILFVVVLFSSIFFLGKYKASGTDIDVYNAYDDAYWTNLEANGFMSYDQITTEIEESYVRNSNYVPPYEEGTDFVERLDAARYLEELNAIYDEVVNSSEYANYANRDYFEQRYQELKAKENLGSYNYSKFRNDNYVKRVVLENDKYRVYFNMTNTQFTLVELDANGNEINTWKSNPTATDSNESVKAIQNSQVVVSFCDGSIKSDRSPIIYDNYTYAIQSNIDKQIIPSYYVNLIADEDGNGQKLQVYYILEEKGINYTYFPKRITKERLIELCEKSMEEAQNYYAENGEYEIDSRGVAIEGFIKAGQPGHNDLSDKTRLLYSQCFDGGQGSAYTYDEQTETYYIKKYEDIKSNSIGYLYRFFYQWCKYDQEMLVDDKRAFISEYGDVNIEETKGISPKIEVAIEYSLTENGLDVMVPGNSLKANTNKDGDEYLIYEVAVLPYFTSATMGDEGYTVIPDGSGSVMNFNNGKTNYTSYNKRVYSSDLSFTSYTLTASTNDLMLPIYANVFTKTDEYVLDENGYKIHKQKGMVVEVTDGAAQAKLYADTSGRNNSNSYNYSYYSLVVRESQKIFIGTNQFNRNETMMYTDSLASCDYHINYMPLDTNKYEVSYSGVASFYRDLLISRSEGKLDVNGDKTYKTALDLDILASYTYDTNFLGIGYTGKGTLTKVDELKKILDEVLNLGVENANVYYRGWQANGLERVSFKNMKFNKNLGKKKELLDLINDYNKNVTIYPHVEFLQYEKFTEMFGKTHYTARDVGGEYAINYPYELNSNVYNKKAKQIMTLSPAYYNAFSEVLAKNYEKLLGINSMSLSGLGSELSGNYRKKHNVFKATAVEEQIKAFENLAAKGINKLAIEAPYAYALEYASNAYNVPYQSTQYEILDYTIPFYQLVINGLFDYSGQSVNEKSELGLQEHIMRCIETGSNPAFTFTFDDSTELLQTDYNTYYYTLYSRWLEDVKTMSDTLNGLDIYSCRLVDHTRLDNDVYKVTYQAVDGSKTIEIILNYQRVSWIGSGVFVPAKSYAVLG